jgi:hypothetical protein
MSCFGALFLLSISLSFYIINLLEILLYNCLNISRYYNLCFLLAAFLWLVIYKLTALFI